MPLEDALDLSWKTLAECFQPEQLLMKQDLVDKYFPRNGSLQADQISPGSEPKESTEPQELEEETRGEAAAQ